MRKELHTVRCLIPKTFFPEIVHKVLLNILLQQRIGVLIHAQTYFPDHITFLPGY